MLPTVEHPASREAQRRKRPFGVTLVAVLQFLSVASLALNVAFNRSVLPDDAETEVAQVIAGAAVLVFGTVVVVGLWTLQRWAWTATMVWVGVGMAWALHSYVEDDPNYTTMVLSLGQVFYLNQREVQRAFQRRHARDARDEGAWT